MKNNNIKTKIVNINGKEWLICIRQFNLNEVLKKKKGNKNETKEKEVLC